MVGSLRSLVVVEVYRKLIGQTPVGNLSAVSLPSEDVYVLMLATIGHNASDASPVILEGRVS